MTPFAQLGEMEKVAQARWREVGNLRKLFKHFTELKSPAGNRSFNPERHLSPTSRGSAMRQMEVATKASVKRTLASMLAGDPSKLTPARRMAASAARFVENLPGQVTPAPYAGSRAQRSDKFLFRGLNMRRSPAGRTPNDVDLFWDSGYFGPDKGVHATPNLTEALRYGSPHQSSVDLHTTAVYRTAPGQRFFQDYGLESAIKAPSKATIPWSTANPQHPDAYETLVTPGRNAPAALMLTAPKGDSLIMKTIDPRDQDSLKKIKHYTTQNAEMMRPSHYDPRVKINYLPSQREEQWNNIIDKRINDRLMYPFEPHESKIGNIVEGMQLT